MTVSSTAPATRVAVYPALFFLNQIKISAQFDELRQNIEKLNPDEVKSQVEKLEKPIYSSNKATFK